MPTIDSDELKEKRICADCVGEPYLKADIQKGNHIAACSYCGASALTIDIGNLSERVHAAFEDHYELTASEPDTYQRAMLNDRESDYDWEREGEPAIDAIAGAAGIPETAAEDVRLILEEENCSFDDAALGMETPYDENSHYREKYRTGDDWQLQWERLERSLRSEARFFSRESEALLASVFRDIASLKTSNGNAIVVQAGPDTALADLHRARVFQSRKKLAEALKNLDREIGSPPSDAAMAGRMNARGISVFYGATDPPTALAEIRPPVGSQVVIGRFEILRRLRLLDISALDEVRESGSIFDPDYGDRLERAAFLSRLGERITRPVMPDDEALDYVVTQAVADFLATNSENPIDGIIYRSAQTLGDARNVVLFQKAARVEQFDRPYQTAVHSSLGHWEEDGWETEYEVIEEVPPPDAKDPEDPLDAMVHILGKGLHEIEAADDPREVTLRLDKQAIKVHEVKAVTFKADENDVTHRRWVKKGTPPF